MKNNTRHLLLVLAIGLILSVVLAIVLVTEKEPEPPKPPKPVISSEATEPTPEEEPSESVESDAEETPSEAVESEAAEPEPEENDPYTEIVSNGVTLRALVDRAVEIALNEPADAVTDGKTKYGTFFNRPKCEWGSEFVMWCIAQAEKELGSSFIGTLYPPLDRVYNASEIRKWCKEVAIERYFGRNESFYVPRKGDIMLFDSDDDGYVDHTGFCVGTEVVDGVRYVLTVEGDIPTDKVKTVRQRRLAWNEAPIFAYVSPAVHTEE